MTKISHPEIYLGEVFRFKGSKDLYKAVYREIDGELFARLGWDDSRDSMEAGRLSREVFPDDEIEIVAKYENPDPRINDLFT
jgi:hypothetical protein